MAERCEQQGCIHIYTGDGKGKTTAAVGLAVRFAGNGGKVLFTQFLKDGSSSEVRMLKQIPGIEVLSFRERLGFSFRMNEEQKKEAAEKYTGYLKEILQAAKDGGFGLLVLDEVLAAYRLNFIERDLLLDFLNSKPDFLEVVMTGRDPEPELYEMAHYVSEICKRKHPFDQGIMARRGIEF